MDTRLEPPSEPFMYVKVAVSNKEILVLQKHGRKHGNILMEFESAVCTSILVP